MSHRIMPKTDELPRALYRAEQVRALDRAAIEQYQIPGELLMARAGQAAYERLRALWPQARDITVLTGTGNNGGDGFVVARLAQADGCRVRVMQLGDRERIGGDALTHARRYADTADAAWSAFTGLPARTDVIVDAILGTGLEREVAGDWAGAIDQVNTARVPVLALDIPSGLHSDTGQILGTAVRASATVSFIGLKQGLFSGDGPACCGAVYFDALDVPARVYAGQILSARRLDLNAMRHQLPPRSATAHKGDNGRVVILGGERGFGGAARLAAEAAARTGAGLVSLVTRPEHIVAILSARPEIMVHGCDDDRNGLDEVNPLLSSADVIGIGPGLGRGSWGRALWSRVLELDKPLVVDADALNLLAETPTRRSNWILTPHPGEAARLLGCAVRDVSADRFAAVRELVARYGGCAILKGAGSLVHSDDARPTGVCSHGNPGMATGGMGDVLTGVISALVAQGHALPEAAELGVCLHAAAGDAAAEQGGERGLLAGDLMPEIRRLVNP